MKLHLGCGQRYFEGYINIDYPLSEHSVQQTSVADEYANLLEMRYPAGAVTEVRLHHVFEHFSRTHAIALLASWNSWLAQGGTLHIETPDFKRTGYAALSPFTSWKKRMVALRHIFGSQEAHWAVHFEGYSAAVYKKMLPLFGFEIKEIRRNKWMGTYNIEVIATKVKDMSREEAAANATSHLRNYMVSDVESERSLLDIWVNDFRIQLEKTIAG